MTHDEALVLIAELKQGRLSTTVSDDVLSHIETCQECQEVAETYNVLAELLSPVKAKQDKAHLSSAEIVDLALYPEELDRDEAARQRDHVKECSRCRSELETVQQADVETVYEKPIAVQRRPWVAALIAASLTLAILGYPAFLGLVETSPQPVDGLLPTNVLMPPSRGGVQRFTLQPDQPIFLLGIVPNIPASIENSEQLQFELRRGTEVYWSTRLSVSQARAQIDSALGVVMFAVPMQDLVAGRYEIRLLPLSSLDTPLFTQNFELIQ